MAYDERTAQRIPDLLGPRPDLTVTLGLMVRTGRAAVVALAGPATEPRIVGKARVDVAVTFEEGAVFHACQDLPVAEARVRIESARKRFTKRAAEALAAFVEQVGGAVSATGMWIKPSRPLPPLESILKSHPLVHAAEIDLYRTVYADACAAIGAHAARYPGDTLPKAIAAALGWTPARVTSHLAAMGKASGRPWAAEQKQAALAAWLTLAE